MTFSWQEPQPQPSRRPQGKKSKKKRKAAAPPPPAAGKRPRTDAEREPGAADGAAAEAAEAAAAGTSSGWRGFVGQLPFYLADDKCIRKHFARAGCEVTVR